ncbi:MAG: DUF5916 domain-containing protein, partial [Lysobacterales bacterium]
MKLKVVLYCIAVCMVVPMPVKAQQDLSLRITTLESAPTIDGVIEEQEWAGATVIDQPFFQFQPNFGQPSQYRTVVRVAQTESSLFIAIEAYDPDIERIAAIRTQRDGGVHRDDSVMVMLDTFGDRRTAYAFRTNSLGTQEDSRIADNGRTVDDRWDEGWFSAARRFEDRWTAELEIPFAILRFDTDEDATWGLNILRSIPRNQEQATWTYPSEAIERVSAFGQLAGLALPAKHDAWTFIPYAIASYEKGEDAEFEAGGDIRWRPTNRLGVDLTINPDFALIEADSEEINLTRFELRIAEKRPFFLEGNEMYGQRIEQFYSRRIGDIDWGAKSNGKIGETDFSTIFTAGNRLDRDGFSDDAEYGVIRFQHGFDRGSNIGLLATNRSYLGDNAGSAGLDTTWFFTDTLGMTAQYLQVHGPTADGGEAWFLRPAWDTARSHFHVRYTNLDAGIRDDFNATGFMRDDDRKEWDTNLRHEFWFQDGPLAMVRPSVNYNRYTSQEGVLRSWRLDSSVDIEFRKYWEIELYHLEEYKLFEKEFRNDRTEVGVEWDNRENLRITGFAGKGNNFDSDITLWGASARWQIDDQWRVSYEVTKLELDPDPEEDTTTIHRFEVLYAYNSNLYAELFMQTNSAIDKENIQAIGVWRFNPPFGSLQVAYQRGTSERGQESTQDDT